MPEPTQIAVAVLFAALAAVAVTQTQRLRKERRRYLSLAAKWVDASGRAARAELQLGLREGRAVRPALRRSLEAARTMSRSMDEFTESMSPEKAARATEALEALAQRIRDKQDVGDA